MVLFWPANLPDDADQLLQDDPVTLTERLQGEGKLIWLPCDSDGGYSLGIFVNEPLPPDLAGYCKHEAHIEKLTVDGEGYFGGGEYMFKHDRSPLDRYSHMAEKVQIPAGVYEATVYTSQEPESAEQEWMKAHTSASALRLWNAHSTICALSVIGVLATAVSLFFLPAAPWLLVAGTTLALIGLAVALSKTAAYKSVAAAQKEHERMFPAYVVHLETAAAPTEPRT